jgi:hypothetical protein
VPHPDVEEAFSRQMQPEEIAAGISVAELSRRQRGGRQSNCKVPPRQGEGGRTRCEQREEDTIDIEGEIEIERGIEREGMMDTESGKETCVRCNGAAIRA